MLRQLIFKEIDILYDFKLSYTNQVNLGGESLNPRDSLYKIIVIYTQIKTLLYFKHFIIFYHPFLSFKAVICAVWFLKRVLKNWKSTTNFYFSLRQ